MNRLIALAAVAAMLGGCAAPITRTAGGSADRIAAEAALQRDLAFRQLADDIVRAGTLYNRLRIAAAEICGKDVSSVVGMMVATASDKPEEQTWYGSIGAGRRPTVWAVFPGGPAERAGIQKGDTLLSVAGTELPDQKTVHAKLSSLRPDVYTPVKIVRNGAEQTLTVTPAAGCRYALTIAQQQTINAYADGEKIIVTQGMASFARSDEELALVIAHELAHNLMKHIDAKRANATGGLLADVALSVLSRGAYRNTTVAQAAAQAYSQEFEAEADYVGLYILARAGLSIDEAPKFWRRMAIAHPGNIKANHSASHPSTASRLVALDAAVSEIKSKIAAGLPLVPNVKDGSFTPPASR